LLDEIDAALDDKNVGSFVNALTAFANVSQYIVITHNRKTVMGASSLLGVTMEESGVSKIITMRLDDDIDTIRKNYVDKEDDFVEEDVPPEEGIVIPPRPPRRDKTAESANNSASSDASKAAESATEQSQE
jgi:chromosome segregation protein